MTGPLKGLRVLDLTRLQPGNYATMVMGDLGAEVVKVEEPGRGDYVRWTPPLVGGSSAMHLALNRNKKSVTLNLKDPRGVDLLRSLVAEADVLIESFRPGVMDRLGVGYPTLSEVRPQLIYAAITGYGQDGPYAARAGHDINYISTAGILGTTGPRSGDPVLPSVQIADLSGAMMAVIGVLSALYRLRSEGRGDFIDVSMMDAVLSWLALHTAPWFAGADPLQRGEGYLNGGFPFYRVYRCGDDKHLSVGALEPQFWKSLCSSIGHPELADEQYAGEPRRSEIHALLEETFATKGRDEWMEVFEGTDSCVAPINGFEEMVNDPQLRHRHMFVDSPLGESEAWRHLGIVPRLKDAPGGLSRRAPGLGEHNVEVYSAIGLGPDQLASLSEDGVI